MAQYWLINCDTSLTKEKPYWREDILQLDLAQGGYDALFILRQGLTVSYELTTIEQIGKEEYLRALGEHYRLRWGVPSLVRGD